MKYCGENQRKRLQVCANKRKKERRSLKTNRGKMDGNAWQKRMENYNMRDKCTNRKIIKNNKMVGKRAGLKHKKTLEK